MKKILLILSFMLMFNQSAMAETIGTINIQTVIKKYSKAQELSTELQKKEEAVQRFLADSQKKIKAADSPVKKKNLEERLIKEFNKKRNDFIKTRTEEWEKIKANVMKEIANYAKSHDIDIVISQSMVYFGGVDITDNVLQKLEE